MTMRVLGTVLALLLVSSSPVWADYLARISQMDYRFNDLLY